MAVWKAIERLFCGEVIALTTLRSFRCAQAKNCS